MKDNLSRRDDRQHLLVRNSSGSTLCVNFFNVLKLIQDKFNLSTLTSNKLIRPPYYRATPSSNKDIFLHMMSHISAEQMRKEGYYFLLHFDTVICCMLRWCL